MNPNSRRNLKSLPTPAEYRNRRMEKLQVARKKAREELLWSKRDPDGSIRMGIPNDKWQTFVNKGIEERRLEIAGMVLPTPRPRMDLAPISYDTKKGHKLSHQVKYGPSARIDKAGMKQLKEHFDENVGKRLTQYSSKRMDYVKAARASGRPLTIQETDVSLGKDPGTTSINHIIASGTGQNMLNRMTLQFLSGKSTFEQAKTISDVETSKRTALKGLAMQAAAVGRMTSVGRAILSEEHSGLGYGTHRDLPGIEDNLRNTFVDDSTRKAFAKRTVMKQDVLTAFQGTTSTTRFEAYKGYMKNTFDSFGNLRLGHGTGNNRVNTGFDMPLTSIGQPTQRGLRLLQTHESFSLPDMLKQKSRTEKSHKTGKSTTIRTGIFTSYAKGGSLSSSKEQ